MFSIETVEKIMEETREAAEYQQVSLYTLYNIKKTLGLGFLMKFGRFQDFSVKIYSVLKATWLRYRIFPDESDVLCFVYE